MKEDTSQDPEIQEYVKAKPEILPKPSYMPFIFAFSLLLVAWGLLTSWIIFIAGILGICFSLYAWIKELLHEQQDEH